MAKFFFILLFLAALVGLGLAGNVIWQRYFNVGGHVADAVAQLAQMQTAHVKLHIGSLGGGSGISLDKVDVERDVDFEKTPMLGDLADQTALRSLIVSTDWLDRPEATLTELIHGRVSRIYSAALKPSSVRAFEEALFALRNDRAPNADESAAIAARVPLWQASRVNLWIDQSSHRFERILVQVGDVAEVDMEFDNVNAPIASPSSAVPLPRSDASNNISPLVSPASETSLAPSATDTDGDGLPDDQEGFYRTDFRNPDTDGDGYSDGEEVSSGHNPLGAGNLFNFGLPTL